MRPSLFLLSSSPRMKKCLGDNFLFRSFSCHLFLSPISSLSSSFSSSSSLLFISSILSFSPKNLNARERSLSSRACILKEPYRRIIETFPTLPSPLSTQTVKFHSKKSYLTPPSIPLSASFNSANGVESPSFSTTENWISLIPDEITYSVLRRPIPKDLPTLSHGLERVLFRYLTSQSSFFLLN